ncbi:MAG TPA: response regulator [Steroidobacteraceae bacterium]|nr:response regulator [Steroidobacteraceae bacterium]
MNTAPILLVEDNPDDVELTCIGFKRANIHNEVIVVQDGREAIDYFTGCGKFSGKPHGTLPSLIVLDLNLPRVSGIELLKWIRQDPRTRFVPTVVLTTSSHERDVLDSYIAGTNGYVQKPIGFDEFQATAGRMGMFWLQLNMAPEMV